MTLGMEFAGFAATVEEDIARLGELAALLREVNLGGTAIGTGVTTPALQVDSGMSRLGLGEAEVDVGTQLIREWRGVEHKVTVLADGFEWEGRRYKSLSAVARAITGTRWNGPLFF
jgi:aspartate ammonia-lyase